MQANQHAMTTGNVRALLVRFSLPLMLGSLVFQGYYLVNSVIVGQTVGVRGLAAIGAAAYLDWFWIGFGMTLVQGFSIHIAQQFGSGSEPNLRRAVAMAFWATLWVAGALTITGIPLIPVVLRLMGTPEEVFRDARLYMSIIFTGMTIPLMTHMAYATLRALGDSRTPTRCVTLTVLINIGLDAAFVAWLRMGIHGAAIGGLLSHFAAWPIIFRALKHRHGVRLSRADFAPDKATLRKLFALGLPMAMQNSIALVGVILLQAAVNGFGALYIAAYSTAMRLFEFIKAPSSALAQAISSFTGQNAGAGQFKRVRKGFRQGVVLLLAAAGLAALLAFAFGRAAISLIIPAEAETAAVTQSLLRMLAVMLPALYLMSGLRAVMQGMGNTFLPMLSGGVELVFRSALALTLPALIGFTAIGIAETSAWVSAALFLGISYYWMMKRRTAPGPAE